jgi:hypothetical protein
MRTSLCRLICFGAVVAAGCGGQVEPAAEGTESSALRTCSDPTSCTLTNGTGVYFEEQGNAGIGSIQMLITHFINNGTSVGFQARALDPASGQWVYTTGVVSDATFNGAHYIVTAIGETATRTYPFVTLKDVNGPLTVYGTQFGGLTLNISISYPQKGQYALTFVPWSGSANYDIGVGNSGHGTVDYKFDMQWRDLLTQGKVQPYCQRAPTLDSNNNKVQLDDSVVFQKGIDVDPLTGSIVYNAGDVTMSCRYGAPATAYWWGYDYVTDPYHFRAAIHMKRASYCGDSGFHTVSGTKIQVQDEEDVQGGAHWQDVTIQDSAVEAFWGPNGALCYNQPRRPDLKTFGVPNFGGVCGGTTIPRCDTWAAGPPYYNSLIWAVWYAQYGQATVQPMLTDGVVTQ